MVLSRSGEKGGSKNTEEAYTLQRTHFSTPEVALDIDLFDRRGYVQMSEMAGKNTKQLNVKK